MCDAPGEYGPAKTLYNHWSEKGVFARIMASLAAEGAKGADHKPIMIDATCFKAHRTASSLRVKKGGGVLAKSGARRAA